MMEEVSIMVAYDAHVFSQLYDEDFLANLVAVSKPRSVVGVCSCCSFASSASGYALCSSSVLLLKAVCFSFLAPLQQFAFLCQ